MIAYDDAGDESDCGEQVPCQQQYRWETTVHHSWSPEEFMSIRGDSCIHSEKSRLYTGLQVGLLSTQTEHVFPYNQTEHVHRYQSQ